MATKKKKAAAKKPAKKPINPVPRQYGTVTPALPQNDAAATIAFCRKAFGAKLLGRPRSIAGAQLRLMLSRELVRDLPQGDRSQDQHRNCNGEEKKSEKTASKSAIECPEADFHGQYSEASPT